MKLPSAFDSSPSWSPDGRRIAFERGPAGDDPGNDVWSMAADGTDQRQLTTSAGLDEGRRGALLDRMQPRCSPAARPRHHRARPGRLRGAGTARIAIRLGPRARARLARVKRTELTLRIVVRSKARRQTIRRSVTITRTRATLRAV